MMFKEDQRLNLTENTQPAVFLASAALFDKLNSQGFNPDFFIGHSIGEYTALFCSGMLDFDDAMKLIIKRSDLMKEAAEKTPGKIMVVFKNEKESSALIRESSLANIYITNKNSENQTAVSGNADVLDNFCEFLSDKNIVYKKLNLSGAFHTPLFKEASERLRDYLAAITFNEVSFSRIISNVTGAPYPEDRRAVKDLLATQIISPVEFIKSIESVYKSGKTHYIEIGPSRLLSNLLKNINIAQYKSAVTIDVKKGEIKSFDECINYLKSFSSIFTRKRAENKAILPGQDTSSLTYESSAVPAGARIYRSGDLLKDDFNAFKKKNSELTEKLIYDEFLRQKQQAALEAVEKFNFNTEKIVIAGVSVGLPGKTKRVFDSNNFDKILDGHNFIEPLTIEEQNKIADKNITRLFKQPDGNARFVEITKTEDVIHLAGQLGYFNLTDEYGIKAEYDISMSLAVAAGIEALKDAGIPLVMQYKKSSTGRHMIPDGFALPKEMQQETGVIVTSLFPSTETLVNEMEKYLYDKLYLKPYEEFENIYFYLMENIKDNNNVKEQITDWFFKIKGRKREELGPYKFDRSLLSNLCPLGSAHLAQLVRAKGPNTLISSACASTTQAIGIAEDWIRVGRCKRVIVVGGENATSPAQNQWIGSGFLALGAATVKKRVSEAAKPFDTERNGTILGSGAVGVIVENESTVKSRGMNGQAEILGTHMANSAYHTYNIDVPHMTEEMTKFISKVEKQHDLKKKDYADKLLFMSHETYTPARGGSADAEVSALKATFHNHLKNISISNTKGFTGHTLGAAIEDVVMVKALQKRQSPPIANLKSIPDHFKELNFSSRKESNIEYGLHLAAGFGSHLAFLFVKRIEENEFTNNLQYKMWLQRITGAENPQLKILDNTLCVMTDQESEKSGRLTIALPVEELKIQESTTPQSRESEEKTQGQRDKTLNKSQAGVKNPEAMADANQAMQGSSSNSAGSMEKIKEIIAEQTGYTTDMLEDDLDLEADLGIDTVKQVEIFAKSASHFGFKVPEDLKLRDLNTIAKLTSYIEDKTGIPGQGAEEKNREEQAPTHGAEESSPQSAEITGSGSNTADSMESKTQNNTGSMAKVKEIIAEQTGYTTDMLEDDLDLEADLGIDTVKQVEIFAKAASHFGFKVPEDLKLRDLNTIAKLSAYVDSMTTPDETPPGGGGKPEGGGKPDSSKTARQEHKQGLTGEVVNQPAEERVLAAISTDEEDQFPDPASPIKRLIVRTKETRMPGVLSKRKNKTDKTSKNNFKGKTFIVTPDSHGFSKKIIKLIKEKKGKVITVGPGESVDFEFDLTDIKNAEKRTLELKEKYREINGFIHLASLDYYFSKNPIADAEAPAPLTDDGKTTAPASLSDDAELNTTFKSVFAIIKGLFNELDNPGSIIGTLTFDSVVFPYMADCGAI
ncbi:MAG: acyltransferase domain-containing protein, partial [Thermodesulfobacteriota bacterium]|nr:acyltransferase domain-containing protein [Thermodesulfobacteriota bacterium]